MIGDNGSNFVGAVNELKELVDQMDKDKIQRMTTNKGIKWKFNPPRGPHFSGVHEIMVKAVKKAIYAVLGSSDIMNEELTTVVAGAEGFLNSRPLTYQSADIKDEVPLTPNHFLYGQMGEQFAPESVDTMRFNPRKRWRKVQELISRVWSRCETMSDSCQVILRIKTMRFALSVVGIQDSPGVVECFDRVSP